MLGLGSLGFTSCSDPAEEITELSLDRLLSPIDIEAKNITVDGATINWKATQGATRYKVEIFADDSLKFAGEPFETVITTETTTDFVLLTYDTDYSVRVFAMDDNGVKPESKGSSVYFRTSAQQILSNPKETDILDTSVDLKWAEGETNVSILELTSADGKVITYNLTAEDIANGKATVTGLAPETEYTAKLYYVANGVKKQRGNRTFKTIMSLEGATVVSEGDNLASIIANAEAGAVIALRTGTYVLNPNDEGQAGAAKVNNTIKVQSIYPTAPATIKGRFEIYNGAGLELGQVKLDGSENATTDQLINYKSEGVHAPLYIHDCDLTTCEDGKGLIYVNVKADIESVTYKNNVIHDVKCNGGDAFDFRAGAARAFVFQNNTVYNVATMPRDVFRMDNAGNTVVPAGTITITNNTFDNVGGSGKRLLYIRLGENFPITFKNNVVSNSQVYISNQSTTCLGQDTPLPEGATTYEITSKTHVADNNYFNAPNMTACTTANAINDKTGALSLDPKYDSAFNITSEELIKNKIGNVK